MTTEAFKEQIKEQLKTGQGADGPQKPSVLARASRLEVSNALREFSVLIAAEYPLHRALRLLASNTTNKHLAGTIEQFASSVEGEAPLWQSMARHPWYYDGVTVSIIRASEAGGKLGEGLSYLADLSEQDQETLCPANWHLCSWKEFNNRNNGWNYAVGNNNPNPVVVGEIYCRSGNNGAGHHTLGPYNGLTNLGNDTVLNCGYGSARPNSCNSGRGRSPNSASC